MGDDKCPYVFCPKCKSSNSWERHKVKDIVRDESSEIMWKGWWCKYCGDVALEPMEAIKAK